MTSPRVPSGGSPEAAPPHRAGTVDSLSVSGEAETDTCQVAVLLNGRTFKVRRQEEERAPDKGPAHGDAAKENVFYEGRRRDGSRSSLTCRSRGADAAVCCLLKKESPSSLNFDKTFIISLVTTRNNSNRERRPAPSTASPPGRVIFCRAEYSFMLLIRILFQKPSLDPVSPPQWRRAGWRDPFSSSREFK